MCKLLSGEWTCGRNDLIPADSVSVGQVWCILLDCKTVGSFLKISKEIGKACRKSLTCEAREPNTPVLASLPRSRSLFSASFQTFCLTARAYLNTQKYGLFCSLASVKVTV